MVQYNKSSFGYFPHHGNSDSSRPRIKTVYAHLSNGLCAGQHGNDSSLPGQHTGQRDDCLWLTTPERSSLLAEQSIPLRFVRSAAEPRAIEVDNHQKFQTIDGFGLALTGGSAQLLMRMDAPKRTALLRELFGRGNGDIEIS
jgi:hypothetical protein